MIRRGEGGGVDVGRAFMVARCWGVSAFLLLDVSERNRTRATIKALPSQPHRPIDSNKIKKAHQLPSFLRLGPGPRRAFALGVAHGVAWLQRLRWRWRDPGGVHKRHLHL